MILLERERLVKRAFLRNGSKITCSFSPLLTPKAPVITSPKMPQFKKLLGIGIALELALFGISYFLSPDLSETFRFAARYSGRLSLVVFLIAMWQHIRSAENTQEELSLTRAWTAVFAVLHFIHLFLLMMNVKLNAVTLIPHKLAGGGLAYLMILLYPIFFERIKAKKAVHAVYFLYVGFVMAMTYLARMKGEFEGAAPELFHKVGLGLVLASMVYFIYRKLIVSRSKV